MPNQYLVDTDERCMFVPKHSAKTLLGLYVSDIDLTSVYPSVMKGSNISRDTFSSAVFKAGEDGTIDIQDLCSRSLNTRENAVGVCSDYLGLPNYEQFDKLFTEKLGESG